MDSWTGHVRHQDLCPIINCAMSGWSGWSACTADCRCHGLQEGHHQTKEFDAQIQIIGASNDIKLCPDEATCFKQCVIEGADKEYTCTYGVTTKADTISLEFVTEGLYTTNVGSRLYMMDNDDTNYKMFHMKHREFTFTVDDADIDCGSMGPCTSYKWTMMVARASIPSTVTWLVPSMGLATVMLNAPTT